MTITPTKLSLNQNEIEKYCKTMDSLRVCSVCFIRLNPVAFRITNGHAHHICKVCCGPHTKELQENRLENKDEEDMD